MKNAPKIEHDMNIRAGIPMLLTKYSLHIDEQDYLDIAVDALRDIKHFGTDAYKTFEKVDEKGYLEIPCNLDLLEGITTSKTGDKLFMDREVINRSTVIDDGYYTANAMRNMMNWPIRARNIVDGFIPYTLKDKKIYILDETYWGEELCIGFSGYITDAEGFPMITRKQANALAAASAKVIVMKKVFSGDKNAANMLEFIVGEAARLKQAASIPEDITDNEIDELMDINTSFNRKSYGRPNRYSR